MFERVGVIGAGTMGSGVAADLTLHGIGVVLVDIDASRLAKARSEIAKTVRFAPIVYPKAPKVPVQEALGRIVFTQEFSAIGDCDFVIENVTENAAIKKEVYRKLDALCRLDVCFSANTSCLSITELARGIRRPERIVGMHFMNPVFAKPVVELMRGVHTSDDTVRRCEDLLRQMTKEAIVVGDMPGFVSNRISHLFMNEAMWVVHDGVATVSQVDQIFKKCFGHAMGPLETADLIGLDVVMDSLDVLYASYQDPKFRRCPLLKSMVDSDRLGRKSGKGFYEYQEE
ncbi:3-hydroxyacyl-CoA dehydrogenase family protein [Bradyrhizobium ontarionense]|uniref:3-hydroxyacyl-CoA dehydrogenase family protein n=1 Tax=Bradyrhizobium ontarionense TaxID=2898149 RepID=A0ABY3R9T4_9BRAD|nr:3-hydroxyacyl-CoA dehydrogenase family protein [Bradyrhizobium sp. A19]UFZ04096.1 3-hydroxyacyl-CoA dehydrogenase family protein [Bradyrhizobium sp. A19]